GWRRRCSIARTAGTACNKPRPLFRRRSKASLAKERVDRGCCQDEKAWPPTLLLVDRRVKFPVVSLNNGRCGKGSIRSADALPPSRHRPRRGHDLVHPE